MIWEHSTHDICDLSIQNRSPFPIIISHSIYILLNSGLPKEKFFYYVYAPAKIHAVMINDRFIQGKIDRFKALLGKK